MRELSITISSVTQCEFKATHQRSLTQYTQVVHEGVKYGYNLNISYQRYLNTDQITRIILAKAQEIQC